MKPQVIVFEGAGGCGKGTQIELFKEVLKGLGKDVLATFEPWDVPHSPDGMRIRKILQHQETEVDPGDGTIDALKLQTMYFGDRCVHWAKEILPPLDSDKVVLIDRERLSTYCYGYAFGLSVEEIHSWHERILPFPELIFYLKCSANVLVDRLSDRGQEL